MPTGSLDHTVLASVLLEADRTLTGGNSNDTLQGGTGNDLIIGNAGHDSLDGGKAATRSVPATATTSQPVVAVTYVFGAAGNDTVMGTRRRQFMAAQASTPSCSPPTRDADGIADYEAGENIDLGGWAAADLALERDGDDLLIRSDRTRATC